MASASNSRNGKGSRALAVTASLVCPGIGQCIQRRWTAGVVYAVLFLTGAVFFVGFAARILVAYYSLADADAAIPDMTFVPLAGMLVSLFFCSIVWLLNVVDAARAANGRGRGEEPGAMPPQ